MEIKKAIITAAGKSQRTLPLQTVVDRDGTAKTALRIIIEEIIQAGVEEIAVVISPGDQKPYEMAAGSHASRLTFVEQTQPLGYGHAVYSAKDFSRSEEHTSELQSQFHLVCRLLLEKKKTISAICSC